MLLPVIFVHLLFNNLKLLKKISHLFTIFFDINSHFLLGFSSHKQCICMCTFVTDVDKLVTTILKQ